MTWPPKFTLPEIVAAPLRACVERITAITLVDSPSIRIMRDSTGTSAHLWGVTGGGVTGEDVSQPVLVRKLGDVWRAGVNPNCFLAQPIVPASTPVELAISGKLSSFAPDASGWIETYENDYFWIEGTVAALVANSAFTQSYSDGGSEGGGEVENDGATDQSKFRVFLAQIVSDGAGGLKVKPMGGLTYKLGVTAADSADSGGGNVKTITALVAVGM